MKQIEYTHSEILQFLTDILKNREKVKATDKILIDDTDFYQILEYDKMFSVTDDIQIPSDILIGSFADEREFITMQQKSDDFREIGVAFLPYLSAILLYLFWKDSSEK